MITGLLQGSDKLNAISEFKLSHMCELEGVEAVGDNGTTGPFSVLNYVYLNIFVKMFGWELLKLNITLPLF